MLDPLDRAQHHFRLAQLLLTDQQLPAARQHVVRALEEAPRYRAAHRLLLEIVAKMDQDAPAAAAGDDAAPATAPASSAAPAAAGPAPAPPRRSGVPRTTTEDQP